MRSRGMNGESRLLLWQRVRTFAVPPSMIDRATARRAVGDWAGACAAAHVDVDLDLHSAARVHGKQLAAQVRTDLRHLAPDLLRWHMPRIAPDGLLRPGLTVCLAQYHAPQHRDGRTVHLVARTAPAWAGAGQRISLALWDGSRSGDKACPYPHPRPNRRFRLDLHRHLWDARRSGELRARSQADGQPADAGPAPDLNVLRGYGCAVDRWATEAQILLRAEGRTGGPVAVRLGSRHPLILHLEANGDTGRPALRLRAQPAARRVSALPVLPDAATWVLPDLALLRAGLIAADQLHPLVASALVPDRPPPDTPRIAASKTVPLLVECRGAQHRIGLVNGALVPLDHDSAEIRREELLTALTGTPLPCLRTIDEARHRPECLVDVRARLDHGDIAGALATIENLLGPAALLPNGALRDELETAALRRIRHGLFRAGLAGLGPRPDGFGPSPARRTARRSRDYRAHPRHAMSH